MSPWRASCVFCLLALIEIVSDASFCEFEDMCLRIGLMHLYQSVFFKVIAGN